jgi:dTDP-4-dehydrorhamnose 3,5-epimerase
MKVHPTPLAGVLVIEPLVRTDERGFFVETWQETRYHEAGIDLPFVQDNHSRSIQGVLRGLHYQVVRPQGKLVRVVLGEVYDVVVDLRRGSATFGRWVGTVLSDQNHRQLWVPPGLAHGFYTLSPTADLLYKCTEYYAPDLERALRWDDPTVGIEWPLVDGRPPILSPKDAGGLPLDSAPVYP